MDGIEQPATRARKGAGSMRQVAEGVWELCVTAGRYDDGTPKRHFRRVSARNRTHAAKLLAGFAAEVHERPLVTPKEATNRTFDEAVREFPEDHLRDEMGREAKTVNDYRRLHEKWFAPDLGRRLVRDVELPDVQRRFGARHNGRH